MYPSAVPDDWAEAIDAFATAQRAAGRPRTTIRTRSEHLAFLARRIGWAPWEVTGEQLVTFAGGQAWAVETRRSHRTTYRAFWAWAVETGRTTTDPAAALPRVKAQRPRPRPMPRRVYLEALARATPAEQIALELAHDHGLRRGELVQVHSRDLVEDLVGWSLVVHGKGNKVRVVPLTGAAASKLWELDGWLFPGQIDGHASAEYIGKRLNKLIEGDWHLHSARHAAGTAWNRAGGLLVAQRLLGHSSVATTQVYCAVEDDELRAAVNAAAGTLR